MLNTCLSLTYMRYTHGFLLCDSLHAVKIVYTVSSQPLPAARASDLLAACFFRSLLSTKGLSQSWTFVSDSEKGGVPQQSNRCTSSEEAIFLCPTQVAAQMFAVCQQSG